LNSCAKEGETHAVNHTHTLIAAAGELAAAARVRVVLSRTSGSIAGDVGTLP
jgi:hypothetical protein